MTHRASRYSGILFFVPPNVPTGAPFLSIPGLPEKLTHRRLYAYIATSFYSAGGYLLGEVQFLKGGQNQFSLPLCSTDQSSASLLAPTTGAAIENWVPANGTNTPESIVVFFVDPAGYVPSPVVMNPQIVDVECDEVRYVITGGKSLASLAVYLAVKSMEK